VNRFSPKGIIHELRRRRVFNTVAIYIVGAWVALQVADLAFPGLTVPESAIRYVWMGAFALFPLVLIFGWRYDIAKDGIRRTPPVKSDADGSLQQVDQWIIGGMTSLALIAVGVMLLQISKVEPELLFTPQENSIAVLPFEVCQSRASDKLLASGLFGKVINRLAEHDRLKVMGRSSSYNMAGFGSSTTKIAGLLKVRYLLSGTLCREGLDLTLEAELTDKDGFVVWRDKFKQVINQFDQVEQRLALLVADGVAVELGDVNVATPAAPVKREALEQLLIGQGYIWENESDKAKIAFEKALELQPGYTEAVWGLALLEMSGGNGLTVGTTIEKAWPMGIQALDLAKQELERGIPGFQAHWVAGRILHTLARWEEQLTWRHASEFSEADLADRKAEAKGWFTEAEHHFRSAIVLNQTNSDIRRWLAINLERQGVHRRAEALEILVQGLDQEPFDEQFSSHVANRLAGRGQFRQAMEVLDRFKFLPQGQSRPWWTQLEIMQNHARFDEKLTTLIEILQTDPEAYENIWVLSHLFWTIGEIASLGLFEEAEDIYAIVEKIPVPEKGTWVREFFLVEVYQAYTGRGEEVVQKYMSRVAGMSNEEILDAWSVEAGSIAFMFWEAGEHDRSIELYESLRHQQQAPTWAERQMEGNLLLADMYHEVGREDDAEPLLKEALTHLEAEVDSGIRHPKTLQLLAHTYALLGQDESALEMMEQAVDYGWYGLATPYNEEHIFSTKWYDSLRADPRFTMTVDRMQSLLGQQQSNIRTLLAHHDMDELLKPVVAMYEEKTSAEKEQGREQ
jgi:TolB-like protein